MRHERVLVGDVLECEGVQQLVQERRPEPGGVVGVGRPGVVPVVRGVGPGRLVVPRLVGRLRELDLGLADRACGRIDVGVREAVGVLAAVVLGDRGPGMKRTWIVGWASPTHEPHWNFELVVVTPVTCAVMAPMPLNVSVTCSIAVTMRSLEAELPPPERNSEVWMTTRGCLVQVGHSHPLPPAVGVNPAGGSLRAAWAPDPPAPRTISAAINAGATPRARSGGTPPGLDVMIR